LNDNDDKDTDDDNDEHMQSDDDGDLMNTKINVEFEARNAEHFDFHGIRKLLNQLLLKAHVDVSQLANEIISQSHVGSVIKQVEASDEESEEDDDEEGTVFGIITALNLSSSSLECMNELKTVLTDHCAACKNSELSAKLSSYLDSNTEDKQLGLVINERFINIPPQIALPSFDSLWKEIERAKKKHAYNFSHYLMILKTYRDSTNKNSQKTFINAEEELFLENAELTFDYSVKSERDTGMSDQWDGTDVELEPIRTVILLSAEKIPVIMQRMRELLS